MNQTDANQSSLSPSTTADGALGDGAWIQSEAVRHQESDGEHESIHVVLDSECEIVMRFRVGCLSSYNKHSVIQIQLGFLKKASSMTGVTQLSMLRGQTIESVFSLLHLSFLRQPKDTIMDLIRGALASGKRRSIDLMHSFESLKVVEATRSHIKNHAYIAAAQAGLLLNTLNPFIILTPGLAILGFGSAGPVAGTTSVPCII